MKYLNKQIFYIDSHNKSSGSHSNFQYIIEVDQNADYTHVVMLDCSIPKSSYTIASPYNSFDVIEAGVSRPITIPEGNYNRTSFKNVLKTKLNEGGYTYDITFDNPNRTGDTGKFTYTCVEINPTFVIGEGLYEQMGFEKNTSYVFSGNSLVSVNVSNFRPEANYYILSDICQNKDNNIFQNVISSGTSDYSYINWYNHDIEAYSKTFVKTKSNRYSFIITDEDYREIHLNGLNVIFTIMIYQENNIDNLIKGFIKLRTISA